MGELWKITTVADRANAALANGNIGEVIICFLIASLGILGFMTILALLLIWVERKVMAHFQCRLGPMRVGPHGIWQSVADALKLLQKEDIIPEKGDKFLFALSPFLVVLGAVMLLPILPASPDVQIFDLDIGVVYVTAISGLGVLGILIGGWSSNNKWSLLGAMRSGAQMISYEISATISVLVVVLFANSLKLTDIIVSQQSGWWIWRAHGVGMIAFLMFLISSIAEINRVPFDLPEGESELTAGFHTEYSGLRWGFFFLAEFINMFIVCSVAVTLFLGGWLPFYIGNFDGFNAAMAIIPGGVWFTLKVSFMVFLMMWIRWTFPRLRIDQLVKLEWKYLLPFGFANLFLAAIVVLNNWYFYP